MRGTPNLTTEMGRFRHKRNLSQGQLAELLGVSRKTVQSVELGILKTSDRLLIKLERLAEGDDRISDIIERRVQEYRAKLYREAGIPIPKVC